MTLRLSDRFLVCVQRIVRSHKHLNSLDKAISAFNKGEMHKIAAEFDAESGYHIHRILVVRPLPTSWWGIIIGDIVHQAHAALDNLIELLNIREKGKPTRSTQFPVYHDRDEYLYGRRRRSGVQTMGSVGAEAAALIESLQPYHRGNQYQSDPLWILHSFWNMDKHRQPPLIVAGLQTLNIVPRFRAVSGTATVGRREIIAPPTFPFVDGTEIARIRIEASPNTEVEVKHIIALNVTFGQGSPAVGREVYPTLVECVKYAGDVLMKFKQFF